MMMALSLLQPAGSEQPGKENEILIFVNIVIQVQQIEVSDNIFYLNSKAKYNVKKVSKNEVPPPPGHHTSEAVLRIRFWPNSGSRALYSER